MRGEKFKLKKNATHGRDPCARRGTQHCSMASKFKRPRKRERFDWMLFRCNAALVAYSIVPLILAALYFRFVFWR